MRKMTRFGKEFWLAVTVLSCQLVFCVVFYHVMGYSVAAKAAKVFLAYVVFRIGWNFGYDEAAASRYEKGIEDGMDYVNSRMKDFFLYKDDIKTYRMFIEWVKLNMKDKEADNDE